MGNEGSIMNLARELAIVLQHFSRYMLRSGIKRLGSN